MKHKKSVIKKLQDKSERLWKEYCYLRDGKVCQVKKYFPQIVTMHSNIFQVDHCFPRTNKKIFIDVANGTVVCSNCNFQKNLKNKAIDLAINDIVIKREGQDTFNRLREVYEKRGAFKDWKNISWLEMQIRILEDLIKILGGIKNGKVNP